MKWEELKRIVDEAGEHTQTRVSTDAEIQGLLKERNKFVKRANEIGQAIQSRQNSIFIEELAKALEAVANEKGHSTNK
jgi:uncharacterized protein YoxC